MVEREENGDFTRSEQIRQELLDYLKDVDFGTPKYQACCDYLDYEYQMNSWRREVKVAADSSGSDPEERLFYESQMRIREIHIALLEREIEKNRTRILGYSDAYAHIWLTFDDLGDIVYEETKAIYPNEENEVNIHAFRKWGEILDDFKTRLIERESKE